MKRRIPPAVVLSFTVAGTIALSAEPPSHLISSSDGWKLAAQSQGVAIYSRLRPGSALKEFKAIGEIAAPTHVVHGVIDDLENYPSFMPYTAECRVMKRGKNFILTYQRLSPKICADRDYTLRIRKKSWPAAEGGQIYLSWWRTLNSVGQEERVGVVRVDVCDGAWLLEPDGANKTRATYSVYTDTGGLIPAFLANHASQVGIGQLFEAVRKQVRNPRYGF
jgi:Polyketide cyclase / dehydrase and lipid transport